MPPCKPIIEFSYKPKKHKRKEMRPKTTPASVWLIVRLNCGENDLIINKCLPHGNLKKQDTVRQPSEGLQSQWKAGVNVSDASLIGIPLKHANYPLASARVTYSLPAAKPHT